MKPRCSLDGSTLDKYVADPQALHSGNRMAFAGIARQGERDDLIAFLTIATKDRVVGRDSASFTPEDHRCVTATEISVGRWRDPHLALRRRLAALYRSRCEAHHSRLAAHRLAGHFNR
jgi:hypothetical protein